MSLKTPKRIGQEGKGLDPVPKRQIWNLQNAWTSKQKNKKKRLLVKSHVSNQSHQLLPTWRSCIYKRTSQIASPHIRKSSIPQLPFLGSPGTTRKKPFLGDGLGSSHQTVGQQKYVIYIMHNLFLYTKWYIFSKYYMNTLPISIMYMIYLYPFMRSQTSMIYTYVITTWHIHQLRGVVFHKTTKSSNLKPQRHFVQALPLVRSVQETPSWQAKVPLWTSSSWSWKNMGIQGAHPAVVQKEQWMNIRWC